MVIAWWSLPVALTLRPASLRRHGPEFVLSGLVSVYAAVFGFLVYRQHSNFGTFGFDIGIHDQGIWLSSRGRSPFVTVRGLDYFAHHVNLISLAFAPFYWLGAGPHFLIVVHTAVVALGAVPLWLLARDRLGRPWLALVVPLAYLLHPAVHWVTWWAYHPDSLAITPLLFAWWLATRRSWGWFAVAVAVALACKEDVALSVVMLGLLVAFWLRPSVDRAPAPEAAHNGPAAAYVAPDPAVTAGRAETRRRAAMARSQRRRIGLAAAAVGAAWYIVATRVIIPWRNNGYGPFYDSFFPSLGRSIPEVLWNAVRHPSRVLHLARLPDRLQYYRQMFGPVGLLPLFALPALLVSAPQFGVNITAQVVQGATIKSQYASLPLVAVFLATVEGLAWLATDSRHRVFVPIAAAVLALSSLAGAYQWGLSPFGRQFHTGVWVAHNDRAPQLHHAIGLIPSQAGVSVTYYMTPQMTHRPFVFEFPNPWVSKYYGRKDGDRGDPTKVGWLLIVRPTLDASDSQLFDQLVGPGRQFGIVYDDNGVVVAKRQAAAG
jgi:uncharacterized membrane protein